MEDMDTSISKDTEQPTNLNTANSKQPRSDTPKWQRTSLLSPKERLIVVANRLPMTISLPNESSSEYLFTVSNGGLVSGLRGIQGMNFIWIGWPGTTIPPSDYDYVTKECRKCNCHPVFLDQTTIDLFYNVFCNNVLWPLIHYVPPPLESSSDNHIDQWKAYCYANARFVDAIIDVYTPNDFVWVHDYHLMLVPKLLRRKIPDARIGWFLHTPFPSQEVFRMLAYRSEMLTGLLSANLIGFHVYDYLRHFLSSCVQLLGLETTAAGIDATPVGGVFAYCSAIPIGIETEQFTKRLKDASVGEAIKRLRTQFEHRKVILGVDRLDYMKGLPHKLTAFDRFLELYPSWNERCVLVQLAIPTRTVVPEYQRLKSTVHEMVGMINGKRGNLTHVPVHYLDQTLTFNELVALYRVADVALITSIRDGMNLVAYEYIACQSKKYGVLILSEFAGAAQSLGAGSIRINPWNIEETAEAIYKALTMSRAERKARHDYAMNHVRTHTSKKWAEIFIDTLREVSELNAQVQASVSPLLEWDYIYEAFQNSSRKILIIDFPEAISFPKTSQGIFTNRFKKLHTDLPQPVIDSLKKLSEMPNTIVIVTTPHLGTSLEHIFENSAVCIAAEKGCLYKDKSNEWIRFVEEKVPLSAHSTLTGNSASVIPFLDERSSSIQLQSNSGNTLASITKVSTSSPTNNRRNSEQISYTVVSNDWSVGVEKIFEFFQQRTPGSHTEKTTGSITWYWDEALPNFGKQQSRDLLVHLWAGPLANVSSADTEVVVGSRFIEVRSTQCGRAKLMANILQYELSNTEPLNSKDLVVCISNFPKRDEDVHELFEQPQKYIYKEQLSWYDNDVSNPPLETNETYLSSAPQYISISVGNNVIYKSKFCIPSPYQVQYLIYSLANPEDSNPSIYHSLNENKYQAYYQSSKYLNHSKKMKGRPDLEEEEIKDLQSESDEEQRSSSKYIRNDILGYTKLKTSELQEFLQKDQKLSQSKFSSFFLEIPNSYHLHQKSTSPIAEGIPINNVFLKNINIPSPNVSQELNLSDYIQPIWSTNQQMSGLTNMFLKNPLKSVDSSTIRSLDQDLFFRAENAKQNFKENSWPPEFFSFAGSVAGDIPYAPTSSIPQKYINFDPQKLTKKSDNSSFGATKNESRQLFPHIQVQSILKNPIFPKMNYSISSSSNNFSSNSTTNVLSPPVNEKKSNQSKFFFNLSRIKKKINKNIYHLIINRKKNMKTSFLNKDLVPKNMLTSISVLPFNMTKYAPVFQISDPSTPLSLTSQSSFYKDADKKQNSSSPVFPTYTNGPVDIITKSHKINRTLPIVPKTINEF